MTSLSPVAERVRRFRERKRSGAVVLPSVTVTDEVGLVELLVRAGLLAGHDCDDKAALSRATGRLLDAVVREAKWEDLT